MEMSSNVLHDCLLACWDRAEEKTVRGVLKAIQGNSKLAYDQGALVGMLMESTGFTGWVNMSYDERHRVLYERVDMTVTRESLEGLR